MGLKGMFRSLLIGAGAGAAVVYLNDPEKGQQRRDQLSRKANDTLEQVKDSDVAAQVADKAAELKSVATDKAGELTGAAEDKAEEMRDSGTGEETADLSFGAPLGTTTPQLEGDLILPGDRPM